MARRRITTRIALFGPCRCQKAQHFILQVREHSDLALGQQRPRFRRQDIGDGIRLTGARSGETWQAS